MEMPFRDSRHSLRTIPPVTTEFTRRSGKIYSCTACQGVIPRGRPNIRTAFTHTHPDWLGEATMSIREHLACYEKRRQLEG